MLSLDTLRKALAPLEAFGQDEHTFRINGLDITVRPLLPVEETQVQRYATLVLNESKQAEGDDTEGGLSRAAALDYFDRFRIEVVANAIVQIGDLDLRKEKTVATGQVLDNGTPVQVPKATALRDMIRGGWSRMALTIAFESYGELVQRLQDTADDLARKSVEDLDIEIERLTLRLETSKTERETRAKGDPTVFADQVETLLKADALLERQNDNARTAIFEAQAVQAAQEERRAQMNPTPARQSVLPASAPPPGAPQSAPAPEDAQPAQQTPFAESTQAADGVDIYRLPPTILSDRGRNHDRSDKQTEINPTPTKGSSNPNFRPSR